MSNLFTAEELKNGKMLCNPLFLPLLLNELEAPPTREQIDELMRSHSYLSAQVNTLVDVLSTKIWKLVDETLKQQKEAS